jgi:hypothetical protein
LWIIVVLENFKNIGEAALRWSFFTLNMFMLALAIIQNE